ncbi:MAG: hypothetical protein ACI9LG_000821 [Moritella dasanensis]|jgi:hypothetical protein
MSNEQSEPRSNWTIRLISPRFNDELYLWMSTIPVFCGLIQFIVSFCYYLRFVGLFFVGSSGGGGGGALLIVILAFLVTIGLFVAFVSGFAYGIASVVMLLERAPWLVYLWLTIVVFGSLLKNTNKVKTIGDNEDKYALTSAYFGGMSMTVIMVLIIASDVFTKGLIETGGGNWFFIPFGLFACFISIFHFFIKPAVTSLIVLYIFFFVKAADERQRIVKQDHNEFEENSEQANQITKKPRRVFSILGYMIIGSVIVLFTTFLFPDKAADLASYIERLTTTSDVQSQTKQVVNKAFSRSAENSKLSASSNQNSYSKTPKQDWNQVYMIPGPKFSFKQLNITQSYQQLINAARRGDKEAKIQVALLYMHGVGVTQDFEKAVYWFNKSAKDKHPQGQKMLAYTYFGTKDKSQNHLAFKYFRAAAQQGDLEAQSWTSRLYHDGNGVKRDTTKANYWNKKATDQEMRMQWQG